MNPCYPRCIANIFIEAERPNGCLCPVCRRLIPGTFPAEIPGLKSQSATPDMCFSIKDLKSQVVTSNTTHVVESTTDKKVDTYKEVMTFLSTLPEYAPHPRACAPDGAISTDAEKPCGGMNFDHGVADLMKSCNTPANLQGSGDYSQVDYSKVEQSCPKETRYSRKPTNPIIAPPTIKEINNKAAQPPPVVFAEYNPPGPACSLHGG